MNAIEVIIILLLLFMAVPDACRKLGRPALAYAAFVLLGIAFRPFAPAEVVTMLAAAGKVGFLMLLFEVGLEIDVPRLREFIRPLRFALPWVLIQYPLILAVGWANNFSLLESLIAAAALTGCSVGMAFAGWKAYPGLSDEQRSFILRVLVTLETLAVILLAVGNTTLNTGLNWTVAARLAGLIAVVVLVGFFARHLTRLFQLVLEKSTHWRTHLLVLLVLGVCALGERIGLAAAKTAFFLGLFMSRAEHEGKGVEEIHGAGHPPVSDPAVLRRAGPECGLAAVRFHDRAAGFRDGGRVVAAAKGAAARDLETRRRPAGVPVVVPESDGRSAGGFVAPGAARDRRGRRMARLVGVVLDCGLSAGLAGKNHRPSGAGAWAITG